MRKLILNGEADELETFFKHHPFYKIDFNLLYLAIKANQKEIIQILTSHGILSNFLDECNPSSEDVLCQKLCKQLINRGIHIDSRIHNELEFLNNVFFDTFREIMPVLFEMNNNKIKRDEINYKNRETNQSDYICRCIKLFGNDQLQIITKDNFQSKTNQLLHFGASYFTDPEEFNKILAMNEDPYAVDDNNCTPLQLAVMKQNHLTTGLLLNKYPNVEDQGNKVAFCLVFLTTGENESNFPMVNMFINHGYTLYAHDFPDMIIPEPWLKHLKAMLKDDEYKNVGDMLYESSNPRRLFQYLVMKAAIAHNYKHIYEKFYYRINLSVSLPNSGSFLHLFSKFGCSGLINQKNVNQQTHPRTKANINLPVKDQMTPLHLAIRGNHPDSVFSLLGLKVNIECRNSKGETPFLTAFTSFSFDCIKYLLNAGCDVNCPDNFNQTPLHFATDIEDETYVELLLKYGANVNAKDNNNLTPLNRILHSKRKHYHIAKILLNHGAKHVMGQPIDDDFNEFLLLHKIKTDIIGSRNIVGHIEMSRGELRIFYKNCLDEVDLMKTKMIRDISLYDVLMVGHYRVANYMKDKQFFDACDKINFDLFPIYGELLRIKIMKSLKRFEMVEIGTECIEAIFNGSMMASVREMVLDNMSDFDLRRFIIVSPIDGLRKKCVMEDGCQYQVIYPEQYSGIV